MQYDSECAVGVFLKCEKRAEQEPLPEHTITTNAMTKLAACKMTA